MADNYRRNVCAWRKLSFITPYFWLFEWLIARLIVLGPWAAARLTRHLARPCRNEKHLPPSSQDHFWCLHSFLPGGSFHRNKAVGSDCLFFKLKKCSGLNLYCPNLYLWFYGQGALHALGHPEMCDFWYILPFQNEFLYIGTCFCT